MNALQLKTAVLDTLVRQDLAGNPIVDSWVQSATTRLNQELLLNDQLTMVTGLVTSKNINLPDDFIAMKSARLLGTNKTQVGKNLTYTSPEELSNIANECEFEAGTPAYYSTYGKRIELVPYKAGTVFTIEMWYYREFPALVGDTGTNFILNRYPQLYLNLTCSMGHQYLLEQDAAMSREALAMAEIQRLMSRRDAEKYGEGPLIVRNTRRLGGRFS